MGAGRPKRLESGLERLDLLFEKIEEETREAILAGSTRDVILGMILEIAIRSIRDGAPVFQNPLEEPILYRYLLAVTKDALDELVVVEKGMDATLKMAMGGE